MRVECYILDLYCDNEDLPVATYGAVPVSGKEHVYKEFPHQYTGPDQSHCYQLARKDGWILGRNGKTICPRCSKK